MTEAEWLACEDPGGMLEFLRGKASNRKLRLFGCACCWRVRHLLQMDAAWRIVDVALGFADCEVDAAMLREANDDANYADLYDRYEGTGAGVQLSRLAFDAIIAARWLASPQFDTGSAQSVAGLTSGSPSRDFFRSPEWDIPSCSVPPEDAERAEQANLLRDIFDNPFRPVAFNPAWRASAVLDLASLQYRSRDYSEMPILSVAFEEAGCPNADLLSHLRSPGSHVRGC